MPRVAQAPKHHYLPVFYLKQWTGPDGQLCEFSRPYKRVARLRKFPDATGYVRGLYRVSDAVPGKEDFLEDDFLKRVDDLASRALRRLLRHDINMPPEMASAWSRFLLSLLHR